MAVERVESGRFPYLPAQVRVGEQSLITEALVDTGVEGDAVLPAGAVLDQPPDAYRSWAFADGTTFEAAVYYGTVRVGDFDPVPADIALIGEEPILGRGITDIYRVILDHGHRVIVEP